MTKGIQHESPLVCYTTCALLRSIFTAINWHIEQNKKLIEEENWKKDKASSYSLRSNWEQCVRDVRNLIQPRLPDAKTLLNLLSKFDTQMSNADLEVSPAQITRNLIYAFIGNHTDTCSQTYSFYN